MLSLVLLIGYAGQISLAQLAFAGIGALAAVEVVGANGVAGRAPGGRCRRRPRSARSSPCPRCG